MMKEACPAIREKVLHDFALYVVGRGPGFGKDIGDRIIVKDLLYSIQDLQAVAVCELIVKEGKYHGIITQKCTALPFILLSAISPKLESTSNDHPLFSMASFAPSQRMDMILSHPAPLGTPIKIVGKSATHIGSLLLVEGKIWDVAKKRLVASAAHIKIMPKAPPRVALAVKL
ncbi:hypothetical protein BU17DRAFT_65230 [Hysterangium stoloniferum]|nr:hypothetical protein BU17DRAFT_65230 [Hysterangium stoloniferum]